MKSTKTEDWSHLLNFRCMGCGKCCSLTVVPVTHRDVARIMEATGLPASLNPTSIEQPVEQQPHAAYFHSTISLSAILMGFFFERPNNIEHLSFTVALSWSPQEKCSLLLLVTTRPNQPIALALGIASSQSVVRQHLSLVITAAVLCRLLPWPAGHWHSLHQEPVPAQQSDQSSSCVVGR